MIIHSTRYALERRYRRPPATSYDAEQDLPDLYEWQPYVTRHPMPATLAGMRKLVDHLVRRGFFPSRDDVRILVITTEIVE